MKLNFGIIWRFTGLLLLINGLFMLACIPVEFIYEQEGLLHLSIAGGSTILLGFYLWYSNRQADKTIRKREGFLIVTIGWLGMVATGALPYLLSPHFGSVDAAFFESMSGYTTTGASILNDIESLPEGLLLWRSLTHWIGGMGIIVLTIAILPILGIGGMELFTAEAPGIGGEKLHPRITQTAKRLWIIYVFLTFLETGLLKVAGMNWFDAVNHSMSTLSTGGFSTKNASLAHYDQPAIHYIITLFMFLAAVNFSLIYWGLKGRLRRIWKDDEFRIYATIIGLLTVVVTMVVLINTDAEFEEGFRASLFEVVAIVTTTGFGVADYTLWGDFAVILFFLMFFLGGSAGSTAGGVKIVRHVVIVRNSLLEFKRLIHPSALIPIRYNKSAVKRSTVYNILAFFIIYIGVWLIGAAVMTLLEEDFVTSLGASIACLGNIGPGIGDVGPANNFAEISVLGKWWLSFLMLLGRLELFTVLILFTPYFWKKV